jgi:hypothetical protein
LKKVLNIRLLHQRNSGDAVSFFGRGHHVIGGTTLAALPR